MLLLIVGVPVLVGIAAFAALLLGAATAGAYEAAERYADARATAPRVVPARPLPSRARAA